MSDDKSVSSFASEKDQIPFIFEVNFESIHIDTEDDLTEMDIL